jgi:Tfp pilus assembly protein PilF
VLVSPTSDREITINAKTTAPDPVVKQLVAEYDLCNASNDHVRCAQYALLLGRRFRSDGNTNDARQYLESAVRHAQTVRLVDYEMDAHGELGLLAKSRADVESASRSFERAIEIGRIHKRSIVRWTQELESLQQ